jgi:hypothetical protein
MEDATEQRCRRRGIDLLVAHCAILEEPEGRVPARDRLDQAVGDELAARLVGALTRRTGRRRAASLCV